MMSKEAREELNKFHRRKASADGIVKLHCHTKMSMGKGFIAPDELVRYAYDKGYKAIAITDCGNVQAFPTAYKAWLKMWKEYVDGCNQEVKKADKNDFLKVIYGLEGNLLTEDGKVFPIALYAKNDVGIKNLYKIVTASNLEYYDRVPLIPSKFLDEHRNGIIIGAACEDGELFDNEDFIADQIEYVNPLREGRFIPEYPNAEEELTSICTTKVKELFGDSPDFEVRKRLERELNAIKQNGYASIYMMWRQLVRKSIDEGYTTGIRGAGGSSFVAYLCGITDINPLSNANGGYQILPEVFMGLDLDKEPDFDINFGTDIWNEIQSYVSELPGVGETCRCGTIRGMSEYGAKSNIERYFKKNDFPIPKEKELDTLIDKLYGTKMGNGAHPGGIIVCPKGEELVSFTPLTCIHPGKCITTEFDYHSIYHNLLKLDILGNIYYDVLHILQEKTGVSVQDIPLNDEKVLRVLCDENAKSIDDFPEFGDEEVRVMIKVAKPETFDDLVKISALRHGTNVWQGNQMELIESGQICLSDCIASRDDIMLYLMNMSMSKDDAYRIMESVRTGKGLTDEQKQMMKEIGIPTWYMQVCEKIRYLFPKSYAVSTTMLALRLAYYMVYYPNEYYDII